MTGGRMGRCPTCARLLLYGQACVCGQRDGEPAAQPKRPLDVRLDHADGRVTLVELAYLGFDAEEGTHVWESLTPFRPGDTLRASEMPARTTLVFPQDEP